MSPKQPKTLQQEGTGGEPAGGKLRSWWDNHLLSGSPAPRITSWTSQGLSETRTGKETEDLKSTHECGWAESAIHFGKQFMSYLPRLSESTDGWTVQPHNDGKEWVQVPLCFTAEREEMKAIWVHETNHFAFREIMSCFKGCFPFLQCVCSVLSSRCMWLFTGTCFYNILNKPNHLWLKYEQQIVFVLTVLLSWCIS